MVRFADEADFDKAATISLAKQKQRSAKEGLAYSMAQFEVRLMFEWGGPCLWGMNEATQSAFGGYSDLESTLPLSKETKAILVSLVDAHDKALDWANPAGPSRWSKGDFDKFEVEAHAVLKTIQAELGDQFLVWYDPVGTADEG